MKLRDIDQIEKENQYENNHYLFMTHKFGIDARQSYSCPGRYINHSIKNQNVVPKLIGERIFFVSLKQIPEGQELLFDYNDRSTSSKVLTWLHQ